MKKQQYPSDYEFAMDPRNIKHKIKDKTSPYIIFARPPSYPRVRQAWGQRSRRRVQAKSSTFGWLKRKLGDFCSHTSLHALRHVVDSRRSAVERIFWVTTFVLSVSACCPMILQVWTKWQEESTVVVFDKSAYPNWKIPFPEVIICNESPVSRMKMNLAQLKSKAAIDSRKVELPRAISYFCHDYKLNNSTNRSIEQEEIYNFLREVSIPTEQFMIECNFNDKILDCSKIFKPRLMDAGLCFIFNALPYYNFYTHEMTPGINDLHEVRQNEPDWNPENGYALRWFPEQPVPWRVLGGGSRHKLSVLLVRNRSENQPECSPPNVGFKIALVSPEEVEPKKEDFLRIPMNRDTHVMLVPNLLVTKKSMRSLEPKLRSCFFQDERSLRFFRFYTQRNCNLECLSNKTLSICGCVSYAMPRDKKTKLCFGTEELQCMRSTEAEMTLESTEGVGEDPGQASKNAMPRQCDCLPACTSLHYSVAFFSGDLMSWDEDVAMINVFFQKYDFIPLVRNKQHDELDFISNCGGLLGLFLGFSLLSGVEVLYFFLLSPAIKFARRLLTD